MLEAGKTLVPKLVMLKSEAPGAYVVVDCPDIEENIVDGRVDVGNEAPGSRLVEVAGSRLVEAKGS